MTIKKLSHKKIDTVKYSIVDSLQSSSKSPETFDSTYKTYHCDSKFPSLKSVDLKSNLVSR